MYSWLLGQRSYFELLARVDRDLAETVRRREPCPRCGDVLDFGRYQRKPRGLPQLPDECKVRHGLCCRRDGCRGRRLPPSVIFLGRRVYCAAAFVLASVLAEGASPRRLRSLAKWIGGASRATLARWRQWWREAFPRGLVGKITFARIVGLSRERVPAQILESFAGTACYRLSMMLELLSPLGTRDGPIAHEA